MRKRPTPLLTMMFVMYDGVISSCSYDFCHKGYCLSQRTLDGQTVTGIGGSFIFEDKGISSVIFPNTLQSIGRYAFTGNSINGSDYS